MSAPAPGGRIIVIGGGGFLGSHVADALSEAGYRVTVVDRSPSRWLRPDQKMAIADIRDRSALTKAFQGGEAVINFAGIADIAEANADPLETAEINLVGTLNSIEAALAAGIKRYLFASTVYVYSDLGGFYRASKQSCEAFIETYGQERGLDYTILRYGTLYGRRAGPTNRIHSMIQSAVASARISYPGSGEALRDFIHVRDAARMTVRTLDADYINRHLLITGQERMRVKDVAAMIAEILPEKVALEFAEGEPEGHYHLTPYTFAPRLGHKLVPSDYIDIGQGLLDCIQEIWEEEHKGGDPVYVPGGKKAGAGD
jgi:UDP-glucose 4-epimerase